ncbi:MAG: YceI family protein [Bacillota bacterium]|jgi:polyisoprenoid-binding protein YceI
MRRTTFIRSLAGFAALALGTAGMLSAQQTLTSGRVREGKLSFDGHATTGDFVGATTTVTGELSGGPELSAIRGWVEAPVGTLKTGNGHRDRDLNSSMETGRYPTMRYDVLGVTPGPVTPDGQQVTLEGKLTIHGISRNEQLTATIHPGDGSVRVTTSFQLDLADYHIGGLTKMLGFLRMDRQIQVHVDVTFVAGSP